MYLPPNPAATWVSSLTSSILAPGNVTSLGSRLCADDRAKMGVRAGPSPVRLCPCKRQKSGHRETAQRGSGVKTPAGCQLQARKGWKLSEARRGAWSRSLPPHLREGPWLSEGPPSPPPAPLLITLHVKEAGPKEEHTKAHHNYISQD